MSRKENNIDTKDPLEADRISKYLWLLIIFIAIATLFEGYDTIILNLALPYLGKDFGVDSKQLGFVVGLIQAGTIAAFALIVLADRFGRRPIFLMVIIGYSTFTALTALSTGIIDFTIYQFIARLFMVTEIGLGSIILVEELPARYRGFGIGIMVGVAGIGGVTASALFPLVVKTGLGWRLLYLVGIIPVVMVTLFGKRIKETRRWTQEKQIRIKRIRDGRMGKRDNWERFLIVFTKPHRRSLFAATSIWFFGSGWGGAVLFFWTYFVMNERGWSPEQVSRTAMLASSIGIVGFFLAGVMLDILGRRMTCYIYFGTGGISAFLGFQAEDPLLISILYIIIIFMNGIWAIGFTITSELFPTEIRASANSVANNLLGRFGMVLAPSLVGILSLRLQSVGNAVAFVSLGLLVLIPVVFFFVPETKERVLEEITPH